LRAASGSQQILTFNNVFKEAIERALGRCGFDRCYLPCGLHNV
jgi:hypothetical protein